MNAQHELTKLTTNAEAAQVRALWARVEADGFFPVQQVVQSPHWTLLVSVPWCRFARMVRNDRDYDALMNELKRPAKPKAATADAEVQLDLFGETA